MCEKGDEMTNYKNLVQEDPEAAVELLDTYLQEAAEGEPSRLTECARLLRELYNSEDESDYALDWMEELPRDCPKGLVTAIIALGDDEFATDAVAIIGGHPCLSEAELEQLMSMDEEPWAGTSDPFHASKSGRASVAQCINATEDMLLELSREPSEDIRYRVAMNPSISEAVQDSLIRANEAHGDQVMNDYILAALALNRATSPSVLKRLAESPVPLVRGCLALRRDLPDEVREELPQASDDSPGLSTSDFLWWGGDLGSEWMADLRRLQ